MKFEHTEEACLILAKIDPRFLFSWSIKSATETMPSEKVTSVSFNSGFLSQSCAFSETEANKWVDVIDFANWVNTKFTPMPLLMDLFPKNKLRGSPFDHLINTKLKRSNRK